MRILLTIVFSFLILTNTAFAQTQAELSQMVAELKTNPNDNALRERIIKLAPTVKPAPVISDEAIRFEGRGQAAFADAKSEADYVAAAQEYEKAVAADPWVKIYYSHLCTIYEKAGKLGDAKRHCGYYLIGLTDPTQMIEVKRRIAGFEFRIEKAATANVEAENAAQAARATAAADAAAVLAAEKRKGQGAEALNKLRGQWYGKFCDYTKLSGLPSCTEAERNGSYWYYFKANGRDLDAFSFRFPSEGVIQIPDKMRTWAGCAGESDVWGVPNGPDPADIRWEERIDGFPSRQIWSVTSSDGSWVSISCNRPLNGADPTRRYMYFNWVRQ